MVLECSRSLVSSPIFQTVGFGKISHLKWFKHETEELLGGTDCLHPANAGIRQVG
jgi:hypothetical protein